MTADDYIAFDSMQLHFGYSAAKWHNEGIVLAVKGNETLTYDDTTETSDIKSWVFKNGSEKGLRNFRTDFMAEAQLNAFLTYKENILKQFPYYTILEWQKQWLTDNGEYINDKLQECGNIADTYFSTLTQSDINIQDDISHTINSISNNWAEVENETIEIDEAAPIIFNNIYKLIEYGLMALPQYQMRWYKYEFGASTDRTDLVGGSYWRPIEDDFLGVTIGNFNYFTGHILTRDKYSFNHQGVSTQIKCVVCTPSLQALTPANTTTPTQTNVEVVWLKDVEKIVFFTNAVTEGLDSLTSTNLSISGETQLNIYNNDNTLLNSALRGKDTLSVDFISTPPTNSTLLQSGITPVVWRVLDPERSQIKFINQEGYTFANTLLSLLSPSTINWSMVLGSTDNWVSWLVSDNWATKFKQGTDRLTKIANALIDNLNKIILPNDFRHEKLIEVLPEMLEILPDLYAEYEENGKDYTGIQEVNDILVIMRTINQYWPSLVEEAPYTSISIYSTDNTDWKSITFMPKENFSNANTSNIVECAIGQYDFCRFPLTFGRIGLSGTDFSLQITPVLPQGGTIESYKGIPHTLTNRTNWDYKVTLFDSSGKELEIEPDRLRWSWAQSDTLSMCQNASKAFVSLDGFEYVRKENRNDGVLYTNDSGTAYLVIEQPYMSCLQDGSDPSLVHIRLEHLFYDRYMSSYGDDTTLSFTYEDFKNNKTYFEETWRANWFLDIPPSTDKGTPGILRCKTLPTSPGQHPNNHVLQASYTVTVDYAGSSNEDNSSQEVTIYAYFPIAIYDPEYVDSFSGNFTFNWNEENSLIYPKYTGATIKDNGQTWYYLDGKYSVQLKNSLQKPMDLKTTTSSDNIHARIRMKNNRNIPEGSSYPERQHAIEGNIIVSAPAHGFGYFSTKLTISCCISESGGEDRRVLFQHPVITSINTHSVNATNKWAGGKVKIDEEEATILATQIGAGHKNKNTNAFTGVIMGDVAKNLDNSIITGLFGYNEGLETFKITTDGDFRIGSDTSFIRFGPSTPFEMVTRKLLLTSSDDSFTLNSHPEEDDDYYLKIRDKFYITKDGSLLIKGKITAESGSTIAGWNTGASIMYKNIYSSSKKKTFAAALQAPSTVSNDSWAFAVYSVDGKKSNTDTPSSSWNVMFGAGYDGSLKSENLNVQYPWHDYTASNGGYRLIQTYKINTKMGQGGTANTKTTGFFYDNHNSPIYGLYIEANMTYIENSVRNNKQDEFLSIGRAVPNYESIVKSNPFGICDMNQAGGFIISTNSWKPFYIVNESTRYETGTGGKYCRTGVQIIAGKRDTAEGAWLDLRPYPPVINAGNSYKIELMTKTGSTWTGLGIGTSGGTSKLYGTWVNNSDVAVSSDINRKHEVEILSDKYSVLFDKLKPIRYKYNDGTSNRFHTGFIAQQVEEAIKESGLTTQEFAGLIVEGLGSNELDYYLRYGEFVALNTAEIQRLKQKIKVLECQIDNLLAQREKGV